MITFKVEESSGKTYNCECCGCYSSSGTHVYVNDIMVWEKYFDGHMGGRQTEDSLLNTVVEAWYEQRIYEIEAKYTDQAREEWNIQYPRNAVAKDSSLWNENKEQELKFIIEEFEEIKKSCENLPYNELIQVKMIALWIEAIHGYAVNIENTTRYDN